MKKFTIKILDGMFHAFGWLLPLIVVGTILGFCMMILQLALR